MIYRFFTYLLTALSITTLLLGVSSHAQVVPDNETPEAPVPVIPGIPIDRDRDAVSSSVSSLESSSSSSVVVQQPPTTTVVSQPPTSITAQDVKTDETVRSGGGSVLIMIILMGAMSYGIYIYKKNMDQKSALKTTEVKLKRHR